MILRYLPPLEYSITRSFGLSTGLTGAIYIAAFLSAIIVCIVNVPLVGYDPITVFQSNFNATQRFWYNQFIPFLAQDPGTLCDAHIFNVGDSLVTNTSLFEWKTEAVFHPTAGESGFSYTGGTMDTCDVVQISFNADMRTWSLEVSMYMYCGTPDGEGVEMSAVAMFGVSGLPARQTNFQRMAKSAEQDTATWTIGNLLSLAGIDIGSRIWEAYLASNNTGVVAYSVLANFEFCPPSVAFPTDGGLPHLCGLTPPQLLNFTAVTTILANNTIVPSISLSTIPEDSVDPSPFELDDTLYLPTANFVHIARAAARIDLGNMAPNNFLTNPQFVDGVLASEFPKAELVAASASQAYTAWKTRVNPWTQIPYPTLGVPGPSTLQAVFVCHFFKLKGPGSLVVSVLVATLSMFSTAWGLALMFAAYLLKSAEADNYCQGHQARQSNGAWRLSPFYLNINGKDESKRLGLPVSARKSEPSTPSRASSVNW